MVTIKRTTATNPDFIELVKHLDAELKIRDGDDHDFYNQFNGIDSLKYAAVAYENDAPVGCGAIKEFDSETVELKRMFVSEASRGKGIAKKLIIEFETWAAELDYKKCILETGINQPEAIALYKKLGFKSIENYGQYEGVEASFCFAKTLIKT